MSGQEKPKFKKLESVKAMKKVMADYFYELDEAAKTGKQKVAWCTSVGPAEILRAMGFAVFFPENHGAMLGATRMATELIPEANAVGYSPDICSYLTADVGAYLKGVTPLSKAYPGIESVPKPDVLVYNTNQCRDVQDWFNWYGRHLNVPVIGVYTHRNIGRVQETHIRSVAAQFKAMVEPLSDISGNKMDPAELSRVVGLSRRCSDLWKEVLETATAVPAPLNFFDDTIHMGPAVVLRGDPRANEYYEILLKELKERIEQGVGSVDGEKFRLYWEGMPVWGKLREHSQMFASLDTCVVASTYCNSWIFEAFDPDDPYNSMARAYTELFIVRSDDEKEKYIERMADLFKIDGILYHDAKTCPNNTNNRYGMPERLEEKLGIPSLTIQGDLNDLRLYSDEQARTAVQAFIEQLEERKAANK
ncbi:MAG: 2-hydroxyacyl-CoA dehydratase [Deltaproteobacteria bacterium]|nr:2-hydroxyacyl-CoA dehydratase [Deltaproteobacteria bacterium]